MRILSRQLGSAAAALLITTASAASADQLAGRWDATVTVNGTVIPFRLDLSDDGPGFTGTLFNGTDTQTTTKATHQDDRIVLELEHYLTTIVATE